MTFSKHNETGVENEGTAIHQKPTAKRGVMYGGGKEQAQGTFFFKAIL